MLVNTSRRGGGRPEEMVYGIWRQRPVETWALPFYCVLLSFVSFIVRFSLRIDDIGGLGNCLPALCFLMKCIAYFDII